jgi:type II secretory pathway pseudopilin PulG
MPLPPTLRARLRDEGGYTLIELVTVVTLLVLVLGTVVVSFTVGIHQQVDQSRREGAYATARLALQRMRLDIHCASGGEDSVEANSYGGFTLTLTESGDSAGSGWCPAVIPAGSGSAGVQWCTIPAGDAEGHFKLYRFLGLDPTDCDGGPGSTFEADFISRPPGGWPQNGLVAAVPASWAGNIWPTPPTCARNWLPSVGLDLNVAIDPVRHPEHHYELRDVISLRNASRCT